MNILANRVVYTNAFSLVSVIIITIYTSCIVVCISVCCTIYLKTDSYTRLKSFNTF